MWVAALKTDVDDFLGTLKNITADEISQLAKVTAER